LELSFVVVAREVTHWHRRVYCIANEGYDDQRDESESSKDVCIYQSFERHSLGESGLMAAIRCPSAMSTEWDNESSEGTRRTVDVESVDRNELVTVYCLRNANVALPN